MTQKTAAALVSVFYSKMRESSSKVENTVQTRRFQNFNRTQTLCDQVLRKKQIRSAEEDKRMCEN